MKPDMVVHNHNLITWSWDKVIPSSRPAWAIKQDCLKKNNKKFQNEKHLSNMSCRWYFQMHLTGHNNNRILCLSWACIAFASLYAVGQREYNFNISQKSEYQDDKKYPARNSSRTLSLKLQHEKVFLAL